MPDNQIKEHTLSTIELLFNANGTSVTQFKLPLPASNVHSSSVDRLLMEKLDYNTNDLKSEHQSLLMQLNAEQKEAYDQVLQPLDLVDILYLL